MIAALRGIDADATIAFGEASMGDFSKRDDVKRWLGRITPTERRQQVATAIAARAAMRAVPLAARAVREARRPGTDPLSSISLLMFRATMLSWVAARYPFHVKAFRDTADQVARAIVGYATATAAARLAAEATVVYADAIGTPGFDASAASDAATFIDEPTFAASVAADANWIEGGGSAAELAGAPLWSAGMPESTEREWRSLKVMMRDLHEDWRVWTDWYDARLAGDATSPANETLEIARASIDDAIWKRGPRAVNAEIARLIAQHPPSPPSAPEPELGSVLTIAQGQLILTNSEPLGVLDRAVQSALHQKLQAMCPNLLEKSRRVGNTHPELLSIVSEYANLVAQPLEQLDVTAIWAVGLGLMAISDTLGLKWTPVLGPVVKV